MAVVSSFSDVDKSALTEIEQVKAQKHEKIVDDGLAGYVGIGKALGTIRKEHLHIGPFKDYVLKRFDINYHTAVRRINAAAVALNLKAASLPIPTNEDQACMLHDLKPDFQQETWRKVMERAKNDGVRVTTNLIRDVLEKKKPQQKMAKNNEPSMALVAEAPNATVSEMVEDTQSTSKPESSAIPDDEKHENSIVIALQAVGKAIASLQLAFQAVEKAEIAGGEAEHMDAKLSEVIDLANGIRGRLPTNVVESLKFAG